MPKPIGVEVTVQGLATKSECFYTINGAEDGSKFKGRDIALYLYDEISKAYGKIIDQEEYMGLKIDAYNN